MLSFFCSQSLAREAFDKIRNDKELKTRQELEETIRDLKVSRIFKRLVKLRMVRLES